MTIFVPDYYPKFRCIAGECRHSCCIGWEIDIDEDTYDLYSTIGGEFGKRLKCSVEPGDIPHFRLKENERCPFLNDAGLCDIILTLGEDALCQICGDHPRFRSFYSDRIEMGLGLCCEAAAQLILTWTEKTALISYDDDGDEPFPLSDEEIQFFQMREKLLEIAQNRQKTLDERLKQLLDSVGMTIPEKSRSNWIELLCSMECLDPARNRMLTASDQDELPELPEEFEIPFEQLLVYFLFRHLSGTLDDGRLGARAAFAVFSCHVIRWMCSAMLMENGRITTDQIAEAARMYSAEYEYSDENTERLLTLLENKEF